MRRQRKTPFAQVVSTYVRGTCEIVTAETDASEATTLIQMVEVITNRLGALDANATVALLRTSAVELTLRQTGEKFPNSHPAKAAMEASIVALLDAELIRREAAAVKTLTERTRT